MLGDGIDLVCIVVEVSAAGLAWTGPVSVGVDRDEPVALRPEREDVLPLAGTAYAAVQERDRRPSALLDNLDAPPQRRREDRGRRRLVDRRHGASPCRRTTKGQTRRHGKIFPAPTRPRMCGANSPHDRIPRARGVLAPWGGANTPRPVRRTLIGMFAPRWEPTAWEPPRGSPPRGVRFGPVGKQPTRVAERARGHS
jgi:hypothetical protein